MAVEGAPGAGATEVSRVRPRAVLMMSGGVESAVVAALVHAHPKWRRGTVAALLVNYGQRALDREERAAKAVCARYGYYLEQASMRVPFWGSNSLVDPDVYASYDPHPSAKRSHILPFRNLMILSLCAAFAEHVGEGEPVDLLTGFDFNPANPGSARDKRPAFVKAAEQAIEASRERSEIRILSPVQGNTKAQTVRLGEKWGVRWADTWSCYNDYRAHCGVCGSCRLRVGAFAALGRADPAGYLSAEERAGM